MLRDKGIEEYAAAAEMVRRHLPGVQFQLLGPVDPKNPNSIPMERIKEWEKTGLVQYLSETDDVRPFLADADCIVLPSYREGVPRSLLEAAAMGRPIITTNVAGCKEVVDHDANGFLCKVKSAADLADNMVRMAHLPHEQRLAMGEQGRKKVMAQFDENIVIGKYLHAIGLLECVGKASAVPHLNRAVESVE
jgi:glycosyltransferase involved in cell wall biosynthesis